MKEKSEEKKVFRGYSDFFLAEELLTEEDARKELLETLRSFRGIDGRPDFDALKAFYTLCLNLAIIFAKLKHPIK